MRKLQLDFARKQASYGPLAWLLLAMGLFLAGLVGNLHQQTSHALRLAEAKWSPVMPVVRPQEAAAQIEGIASIRLATPWPKLFAMLERVEQSHIGLITLEADAEQRAWTIRAEGRNAEAMLAYYSRLHEIDGLSRVNLAEHAATEGELPVRFTLRGHWGKHQ